MHPSPCLPASWIELDGGEENRGGTGGGPLPCERGEKEGRKEGRKLEPSLEASRETIYGHWKQCAAGRQRVPLPFFSPFATAAKLANPVCPTTLFFPPFPPLLSSAESNDDPYAFDGTFLTRGGIGVHPRGGGKQQVYGSKIFSRMKARGEGCIVADRMVGRVRGIEAEKLVARVSRTEGKKEWLTQI